VTRITAQTPGQALNETLDYVFYDVCNVTNSKF